MTFHGAGLVVPYDRKTQVGYREIPESNASLKKILTKIVDAQNEDDKNKAFDPLQVSFSQFFFNRESLKLSFSHFIGTCH